MWLFNRKGPSGFSSFSTAEEVTEGIDGSGLTAIVTGASSGIGSETARVLAVRGVHVVMGVRNMSTGDHVKKSILKEVPSAKINLFKLDLSSMASVKNFASDFLSMNLPLNILINNAGIMATPFLLSDDGVELQFATNHIGHFLLTDLLLDKMKETSSRSNLEGRIINITSESHRFSYPEGIRFDMINDDSGYNEYLAYGQSNLANILHANELARRFQDDKVRITANSVHPGTIATNMFRAHGTIKAFMNTVAKMMTKTIEQGAATTCYVALHPQVKGVTGKYFNNSNIHEPSPQATDRELAKRLWELSMSLISN